MSKTKLYKCWKDIKCRCYNIKNNHYYCYGQKGVIVCHDWFSFIKFRDWAVNAGYKENLTIDRVDANGNYEPDNCRWVTKEDNHKEMMNRNLKNNTGIFSEKVKLKAIQTKRILYGKPITVYKNNLILSFGSRGELVEHIVKETGRDYKSVKSHITIVIREGGSVSGYKILKETNSE